jgi:ABC-type Fe3+ transport system substrate-binding protein
MDRLGSAAGRRALARGLVALGGLMLAALALGAPASAEDLQALYQQARSEGELNLYGGGPARLYEPWIAEFKQQFPGIRVQFTGGYAGDLAPAIDRQLAQGRLQVDFVTFQAVQEFLRWRAAGVLQPFKVEGFETLDPRFRDPEGAFTPVGVFAIAPAYNPKLLAAADVPRSALDFLKPALRGRLISAYPHDDDATLFAFQTIVDRYGWSFMDRYMQQQPQFIQGHLGVVRSLASGQSAATLDMMVHHTLAEKRAGQPVEVAFPADDPMPVWGQLGALFRASPHPAAARLYLQWYMAPAQQRRIGTWSARSDVPAPEGLRPISQYAVATDFAALVSDPARLAALRARYRAYTGEITRAGGTR